MKRFQPNKTKGFAQEDVDQLRTVMRQYREGEGWTQDQMAAKCKVSRAFYAQIEGRKPITLGRIIAMLRTSGFNLSILIISPKKRVKRTNIPSIQRQFNI